MTMWKVIVMAENKDDSVVQEFDDEAAARAAFAAAELAGGCVNLWHNGRRIGGDWIRVRNGHRAHKSCVDSYNSTIECGLDHGSCSDDRCWLKGWS
jgi:hypothetical protein